MGIAVRLTLLCQPGEIACASMQGVRDAIVLAGHRSFQAYPNGGSLTRVARSDKPLPAGQLLNRFASRH
jgi:hypothetical protein